MRRASAAHQLLARLGRVGAGADGGDHLIHIRHRHGQTAQHMAALARLVQLKRRAARDHFFAEGEEGGQEIAQGQLFGPPPFSASMLQPKLVCIGVKRNSWFSTTSGVASRFSSITTRTPIRSDSSATEDPLDPLVAHGLGDLSTMVDLFT
jgi:hypothetical protein